MNCKPGDLAFIVRSSFPENIGRIVRVDSQSNSGSRLYGPRCLMWNITACGSPLSARLIHNGRFVLHTHTTIADSHLRPIRPEPELLPAPPVAVTA